MPGLSDRGLDHSVHASSTPQLSQQRSGPQSMNLQAPGFESSPVTFYARMLQNQPNSTPILRETQQDHAMQPYLSPRDENEQRITNLELQIRQFNMAFRNNDLESRQNINLLDHEIQNVRSVVERDIPWLNSRVNKLEQQAAAAFKKAGREARTQREKCRDAMENPVLVKIASGQYVPAGKKMVEAYISEAETAEALAAELRSYAIQAGADRSVAHSSAKKLDQLELSQPLAQLGLETPDSRWSEEELNDFRPSELDLVVNQWLQKNYAPLMVQTMGARRWGQEFDLDRVMLHQSKMKAQAALHHRNDHKENDQMDLARRAFSPTSSERTLTEKTTNCAIRPDESISAVHSHVDDANKPTGTSQQLTTMEGTASADIPIPSTEDAALRNSKTWQPTYIARLPPLANDKASHVPAPGDTETFARSFLVSAFGDHATQYSPDLYWVSKKVKCILPNRLFWIIDEDFEPFLPKQPGKHGAKLTAFFNPGGDDDGPGEDSYLNAPVFIARSVFAGDCGSIEKEYVYFGQYSQTRFSDKLDYDRMQEVVPNHVKEWWATTLAQTDRPPWMTEALINHFWPKPPYDGPLPHVPTAETDGDDTTAPSAEAVMPKARKAMEHHLRELAEFDAEDRLKVSFLTKEAIMKAFDEPDCASEPGLRLYWEYMECINWDAGFYAMLVAKKKAALGPATVDTMAGARKTAFKPALRPGVAPKSKPATRGNGLDGSLDLPPPASSASTRQRVELCGNGEREGSEESSASTSTLESTATVVRTGTAPAPAGNNEPVLFNPSLAMTLSPRLKLKPNKGKKHADAGGVIRKGRGSFKGYDEDDYVPEYFAGDEKGGKKGKTRERKAGRVRGMPY